MRLKQSNNRIAGITARLPDNYGLQEIKTGQIYLIGAI
jgi:hypothetical protein